MQKTFLIIRLKVILKHMIIFEKFQKVKQMFIQLVVLLDYNYFKEHYKMIAIDLSKQQELDYDPKAIQHISFTGNLEQQATMFFIIEEAKETVLDFLQGTVKVF